MNINNYLNMGRYLKMKLLNTNLQLTWDVQDIIATHMVNIFETFPISEINTKNHQVALHIQNLVITYGESLVKAELEYQFEIYYKKAG